MPYLLDTNILSDLVRQPQGRIAKRISEVGEGSVATSIIVAAELLYGATRRGSSNLLRQVEAVLDAFEILPLASPAEVHYAHLRTELEKVGRPIGGNDLLIAAHALSLGYTLVTGNVAGVPARPVSCRRELAALILVSGLR